VVVKENVSECGNDFVNTICSPVFRCHQRSRSSTRFAEEIKTRARRSARAVMENILSMEGMGINFLLELPKEVRIAAMSFVDGEAVRSIRI